jgi:hypothetical protein
MRQTPGGDKPRHYNGSYLIHVFSKKTSLKPKICESNSNYNIPDNQLC